MIFDLLNDIEISPNLYCKVYVCLYLGNPKESVGPFYRIFALRVSFKTIATSVLLKLGILSHLLHIPVKISWWKLFKSNHPLWSGLGDCKK